jgi:two-component system chemotaxis response regulator CheB
MKKYKAVVVGVSAGGMAALTKLLSALAGDFPLPVIIVQHLHPHQGDFHLHYFNEKSAVIVKEADEKEKILPGYVYFAPPNYHLLIEEDESFSLSSDAKVNFSRPSVDVLFESAADVYSSGLIGIILTGANNDGAHGLSLIKKNGGLTIVQDPLTAESPFMPQAAIETADADYILSLEEIGDLLIKLMRET